jgi:hypothetical protein
MTAETCWQQAKGKRFDPKTTVSKEGANCIMHAASGGVVIKRNHGQCEKKQKICVLFMNTRNMVVFAID